MVTRSERRRPTGEFGPVPIEDRFWAYVQKGDGCWTWTGTTNRTGYGRITYGKRKLMAHRVAWELLNGPIPEGLYVCHKCDNPLCVNAESHLFLGTASDNSRDRTNKGRQWLPHGSRNGRALLTEAQVETIRAVYAAGGITQAKLGIEYGVGTTTIQAIVRGRNWR